MEYNNQNFNAKQFQNEEQYNQLKNELEEIKKRDKSNRLIIALLLIVALFLILFSTYIYTKLSGEIDKPNNSVNSNENEYPNEPEKKEVTANYCYKNKLVGTPGKSEACLQEEDCQITDTIYNKQVIRLSGDTEGVKAFNTKLEKIITDYAWDRDTKEHTDYTCNSVTEADMLTGVTFNYYDEIYQLSDKYIILRININHENLVFAGAPIGVDEIFIFDIKNDKEITKQEFIQALKNNYDISIKMSCGDPSTNNYLLKDENNQDITSSTLALKINDVFDTQYDGELLNKLFLDMYFNTSSKDYVYKPFRSGETTGEFYQMYLDSRCSEQQTMF